MSTCSNWGDLNGDVLDLILSKLFAKDRHSFSLVCRHWNAISSISPYRYSPCLMYYYRPTGTWKFYQYNAFFNMSFPELEDAELRCSKYGWLLMSGYDESLFFFDPSNNQKVELPSDVVDQHTSLSFFNPPTSPECVVVGITTPVTNGSWAIIYTLQYGEDQWERMEYTLDKSIWVSLGAPALYGGLIYILGIEGDVAILDIKRQRLVGNYNCLRFESVKYPKEHYLVKVNGEDELFGVFVWGYERKVTVFKLSSSDMKWDLVESIGDKVLYLSHMSSYGCKAPTKSMENTIYFPKFHGQVPVFYSLSDGKYRSLTGEYLEGNVYGIRILDFAAWIMPIPALQVTTMMEIGPEPIFSSLIYKVRRTASQVGIEQQRLPLLLRSHSQHSEKQSIYNLLEDRYYTMCLPVLCNKSVICSAYGWLVLLNRIVGHDLEGDCCLWNPTSMEIIQLPRIEDPHPYNSCVLSKSPTDPDCFIVFKQIASWMPIVCRIEDSTLLKVNSDEERYEIIAMVLFQGVIYGIINPGYDQFEYEFVTVHMDGDKLEARPLLIDDERHWGVPQPTRSWVSFNRNYLIESPCGNELLLVTQMLFDVYLESCMQFRVFRVNVGRKECKELESLDGRTIFLSFCGNGFCRSSKCFGTKIKPNSIYYTNSDGIVVYVYDMDDRSTTMLLPCPDADIDPDTSEAYFVDLPDNIHNYLGLV